jgi:CheY-like chemotaxis protein
MNVILSAAKNVLQSAILREIPRHAQNDVHAVNAYANIAHCRKGPPMRRILLVEDDRVSQEVIKDLFEDRDIPIDLVCVETGEEALLRVPRLNPLIVLMDIRLPGIDGLTTTRAIKSDAATKHIPVWAITALNRRSDIDAAIEAGCSAYFVKPINRSQLADQICILAESLPPETKPSVQEGVPV